MLVATLILVDTYAGRKGSLREEEVRAGVAGARQMQAAHARDAEGDDALATGVEATVMAMGSPDRR